MLWDEKYFFQVSDDMTCKGHMKECCDSEISGLNFIGGQVSLGFTMVSTLRANRIEEVAIVEAIGWFSWFRFYKIV